MVLTLTRRLGYERLRSLFAQPHDAPTFIFGNQKSGTSVTAGLLSAATGERLVLDFAGAREPYIGRLLRGETPVAEFVARNAWAFSAAIVKEPGLTFVAPALLEYFPASPAIFVLRDPWSNIRSILGRLRLSGDAKSPARTDGSKINRTWQSILAGSDFGLAPDHYIDVLARRWLRSVQICESLGSRVTVLRYEDFNRHKEQTVRTLADKVGMPVLHDFTPLLDFSFQRSGQTTMNMTEFFGPNLSRIGAICGPAASRLGYAEPQPGELAQAAE